MADAKLPELCLYRPEDRALWLSTTYRHLSRLTALTKLVICAVQDAEELSLPPLDSLVELLVYGVGYMQQRLYEYGPLTSLQKLHWENCEVVWPDDEPQTPEQFEIYEEEVEEYDSQLLLAATALQDLPQLRQISGRGKLIDEFMLQSSHQWRCTEVSSTAMGLPCQNRDLCMWIKV